MQTLKKPAHFQLHEFGKINKI